MRSWDLAQRCSPRLGAPMPPLASRLLGTLTSVDELYKYVGIPVAMVGNEFPDYATGIVMIADVKHPCLSGCARQALGLCRTICSRKLATISAQHRTLARSGLSSKSGLFS